MKELKEKGLLKKVTEEVLEKTKDIKKNHRETDDE